MLGGSFLSFDNSDAGVGDESELPSEALLKGRDLSNVELALAKLLQWQAENTSPAQAHLPSSPKTALLRAFDGLLPTTPKGSGWRKQSVELALAELVATGADFESVVGLLRVSSRVVHFDDSARWWFGRCGSAGGVPRVLSVKILLLLW